ncbi:MAG: hypothetical protein OEY28_07565, partial [Nitrospira sp.]|nr:hypothetical protein [Nitrospira sp.]
MTSRVLRGGTHGASTIDNMVVVAVILLAVGGLAAKKIWGDWEISWWVVFAPIWVPVAGAVIFMIVISLPVPGLGRKRTNR